MVTVFSLAKARGDRSPAVQASQYSVRYSTAGPWSGMKRVAVLLANMRPFRIMTSLAVIWCELIRCSHRWQLSVCLAEYPQSCGSSLSNRKNRTGSGMVNATTDAQRTAPLEHNQHFAEIVPMGMRLHPMLMTRIPGGCRAMSLKSADPDPARRARHDTHPDFRRNLCGKHRTMACSLSYLNRWYPPHTFALTTMA